MRIIAIDPGPASSAFATMDIEAGLRSLYVGTEPNADAAHAPAAVLFHGARHVICEAIAIPGHAGLETYRTAERVGALEVRARQAGLPFTRVRRPDAFNHAVTPRYAMCGGVKTSDAKLRVAVQHQLAESGLALKMNQHEVAAVAVLLYWLDKRRDERRRIA